MSSAVEGYGSTIQQSTDSGATYGAAFSEVVKISGPSFDGKDINVSHLQSPNGFDEFIPGMVNAGEVHIELNFVKAQAAALYAMFRSSFTFKVTFSQGSTWVFVAFIKQFGTEVPRDDKISNTAVFKVSGKPVFTA